MQDQLDKARANDEAGNVRDETSEVNVSCV